MIKAIFFSTTPPNFSSDKVIVHEQWIRVVACTCDLNDSVNQIFIFLFFFTNDLNNSVNQGVEFFTCDLNNSVSASIRSGSRRIGMFVFLIKREKKKEIRTVNHDR